MFPFATKLNCLPCGFGLFWLQSLAKFTTKFRKLCLATLGHVDYFAFNMRQNSQQNFESSASLRSAMWIIWASISEQTNIIIISLVRNFEEKMENFKKFEKWKFSKLCVASRVLWSNQSFWKRFRVVFLIWLTPGSKINQNNQKWNISTIKI